MDCPFCLPAIGPQIVLADAHCFAIWTEEIPTGSAMVLPRQHRPTVFDLTEQEWLSTQRVLAEMKSLITEAHRPDGWNVGWNVEPVGDQSIARTLSPRAALPGRAPGRTRHPGLDQGSGQPPPGHPPLPRPAWLGA